MKTVHCCKMMDAGIKSNRNILEYNASMREYSTICYKDDGFLMYYCPFCGTQLPNSLRDQWFDEISKELGFEVDLSIDKRKIPSEFLTEEWWKKRGL